jgi:hypothetical protein
MKTALKIFAGLVVLGLILQAFEDKPKAPVSAGSSGGVSSDPACVQLRAKMSTPGAISSITSDDLILAQRCGSN